MLLLVIDQDEIAAFVVVERIGMHGGSSNTGCMGIAGVCAGKWGNGMVFDGVYVGDCVGITKIITPQTPTAAGTWPERCCRTGLLPNGIDILAGKRPRRYISEFIAYVKYWDCCRITRWARYYLPPTHSP